MNGLKHSGSSMMSYHWLVVLESRLMEGVPKAWMVVVMACLMNSLIVSVRINFAESL